MHEKKKNRKQSLHFIKVICTFYNKNFVSSSAVMPLFSDSDDDVILILRTTLILEQKVVVRQIRFGLNTQDMNSV